MSSKLCLTVLFYFDRYRCLLKGRIPRGAPTKEISRVILDGFSSGHERDSYALGSSKVFLRENLEAVLEKTRQDIQEVKMSFLIS
jgi:myosin heavy subunit